MAATTRILRPALSLRYQQLRRASIIAADNATTQSPPKASFIRRNRGRIVWSVTALVTGIVAGNFVNHTLAPPALPDAGTLGDRVLMADLNKQIDGEFKVQVLRGKCLGVTRQLEGKQGGWVEVIREDNTNTPLVSSLAGAKGLGVERLFWNGDEEKLVAIVWFGGSLSGWPGVTHGGLIATQMVEKIGIVAALMHGSHRNISVAAVPQRLPGTGDHAKMLLPRNDLEEPEELSLSYVKPTYANGFYVIRVSPALPINNDPMGVVPQEPASGKHDYEAILETMDARTLVKAKARIGTGTQLHGIEHKVEDAARWTNDRFRQWMWPSRQDSVR